MKRDHCESLYRETKDAGASLRTLQATHTALRQVVKHGLDRGWIEEERDPMAKVRRPGGSKQARVKDIAVPHWSAEELSRILEVARETLDPTHRLLVEVLARTGVRIGEALGLRFRDHTHRAHSLKVERSWTKAREVSPVKSETSRRTIKLTPELSDALASHRRALKAKPEAFVFQSGASGLPVDQDNFRNRIMRRLIEAAGVPHHGPHAFRHTHATILIERGISPKVVQLRLGHADIATTLRVYGHATPAMQDAAVQALSDL